MVMLPVLLALLGVFYTPLPSYSGVVYLAGLSDQVTISRDSHGIPAIHANTRSDLLFAQGYVHAQDRLYAMDLLRRMARGRLAELLGVAALEADIFVRNIGVHINAEKTLESLSESELADVLSYSNGINAYVKRSSMLPWEYILLWAKFEPWQPIDTISCVHLLGVKWGHEFLRYQLEKTVGEEIASLLLPETLPQQLATFVIRDEDMPEDIYRKPDREQGRRRDGMQTETGELRGISKERYSTEQKAAVGAGSNAWVISGNFTKSGKPLLATDTHMPSALPCLWYLLSLHLKDRFLSGGSIPGLPSIFTGRNNNFAWGITALEADTIDVYVEKRNPKKPYEYLYNTEHVEFKYRTERVKVRGEWREREVVIEETNHGPVLKDYGDGPLLFDTKYLPNSIDQTISIHWALSDAPDTTLRALLSLWEVRTIPDLRKAFSLVSCCTMGVVYASDKDIGYQATGRIPDVDYRDKVGNKPLEGWNVDNHWDKLLPSDKLPYVINPSRGFIVAANNEPGEAYIHKKSLGTDFLHHRAKRITDLIEKAIRTGVKLSIADMVAIQKDEYSVVAAAILPTILSYANESAAVTLAYQSLVHWNYVMSKEAVEPSLFQVLLTKLMRSLISDEVLNEQVLDAVVDSPAFLDFVYVLFEGSERVDRERWCDQVKTKEKESCRGLISRLLLELDRQSVPAWGQLHETQLPCFPFSSSIWLRPFLHHTVPAGGAMDTVNARDFRRGKEPQFTSWSGPNIRLIMDMAGEGVWGIETVIDS